jgi:hypothetical protein
VQFTEVCYVKGRPVYCHKPRRLHRQPGWHCGLAIRLLSTKKYFGLTIPFTTSTNFDSLAAEKEPLNRLQKLQQRLTPIKDALVKHRIYGEIDRIDALRLFMEHHVFAVWDFMSLLKVLQRRICCVDVPWLPSADSQGCRFINEIVLAEESDIDARGRYASHFELYHGSMRQCGASTAGIDGFLSDLRQGIGLLTALESPEVPEASRPFVQQTFKIIESGNLCEVAAAFTFGREDLLPDVFQRIVDELNTQAGGRLEDFKYYLERHIGLDGDEHGPMATRLLQSLCGDDDELWEMAEQSAVDCLLARQRLWDGIYEAIRRNAVVGP